MNCPNCHAQVPTGPECPHCGVVFAKFKARAEKLPDALRAAPAPVSVAPRVTAPRQAPTSQKSAGAPSPVLARSPDAGFRPERPWPLRPVSDARLAGAYGQLARMLESGLPLSEGLRLIAEKSGGRLADGFSMARLQVEGGATLSDALSADEGLFPEHVRALVRSGESTGGLPAVFRSLAEALELRLNLRRRLLRACLYPFILFTLSFFLIPLSKLITGGVGAYLGASLVPYLVALVLIFCVGVLLPWLVRTFLGPVRSQRLMRALPLVGPTIRQRANLQFARHLATSLGAGLDMFTSLSLAGRASGDAVLAERLLAAVQSIQKGGTLEAALAQTRLFTPDLLLAVASGEVSGRLQEALEQQTRLEQEAFVHRLEVSVQISAVVVLLGIYAYVAWSIMAQYTQIFGDVGSQIDQVLKEAGGGPLGGGEVPAELKGILP